MLSCRRRRVLVLAVVVRGVMQRCGVGWSRLWLHRGIVASSLPFVPFCVFSSGSPARLSRLVLSVCLSALGSLFSCSVVTGSAFYQQLDTCTSVLEVGVRWGFGGSSLSTVSTFSSVTPRGFTAHPSTVGSLEFLVVLFAIYLQVWSFP